MSPATWGKLLALEVAALARIAPGDADAQERAGRAAIAIFPRHAKRVEALRGFAANRDVTKIGSEFAAILEGAAHNGLVIL
mgnify:CR=1 FL=1